MLTDSIVPVVLRSLLDLLLKRPVTNGTESWVNISIDIMSLPYKKQHDLRYIPHTGQENHKHDVGCFLRLYGLFLNLQVLTISVEKRKP